MVDLKHISKNGNNFAKHDVYHGNIHPYSSRRDYAFGYIEFGNTGYITFISYRK